VSFISYAQNFEDALLWRALNHVTGGFYIDVGANDPVEFSVTKAFYDAGWNGINIEPLDAFHASFMEQRPRDINLAVAAGAEEGEVVLFDVPAVNGWASSSAEVAAMHRAEGYDVVEQRVPLRTLDAIWHEHVTGPVHFLKIDVEGFEEQVLRGLNLAHARPWVLVIEATTPNSRATNHDTWEHLVTSHDYLFAYFDGLNRYYVAIEHAQLLDSLQVQVNVFDDVIPVRLSEALQENAALQEQIKVSAAAALAASPGTSDMAGNVAASVKQRLDATDTAMTELWTRALPSLTQQLNVLAQRMEQVHTGAIAESHAQTEGVEQRLRETLAMLERQVSLRLADVDARGAESAAQTAAMEARMHGNIAALDKKIDQLNAAVALRETEWVEQLAALDARLLEQSTAFEARLMQHANAYDQKAVEHFAIVDTRFLDTEHVRDRRLATAEEMASQASRRIVDAELATALSADRVTQIEQRALQLEQHIAAILTSSSWRMTAPLRKVGDVMRRVGSAARDGRLHTGARRRIVRFVLGPATPEAGHGLRLWMRHAAQLPWARKIVLPAMQRYPRLNTAMRRLAGTSPAPAAAPTGELFLPIWAGALPVEYLMMPASARAVLLDLARASEPQPAVNPIQS
jgi:FkbM family methyltransferase